MAQRRRVPFGNTVEFVDATPRGLVDVKNIRSFMEGSPKDFPAALKKVNEDAARNGGGILAIRVPVAKNLLRAPYAVQLKAAQRISYEAFILGRVDRIAGDPDHVKESIYIMLPDTIDGVRVMDRRGLRPCPRGFVETTPNGFKGTENSRQFLEEAPSEFLEAYKEAEKKAPGRVFVSRVTTDNNLSEAETFEASLDATWKALQINPHPALRVSGKEDLAAHLTVFTHGAKAVVSGDAKTDPKNCERAAGGGGIADKLHQSEKEATSLIESEGVVAKKDKKKKNRKKKGKKALGQGGIEDMNDLKATVDSIDTERETVC